MGRPKGHAGRELLEERWDEMNARARNKATERHTNDIVVALMSVGCIDWLPSCLVAALKGLGMFDELMSTKAVAKVKLELVQDLAKILESEWGTSLALFIRGELNVSDSNLEKLRLAFCKRYDQQTGLW
eukprot:4046135-Pleurochrysis_carterae.AAC.1